MRALRYFGRAMLLRCPSCGEPTLVRRVLGVHERCRGCGLFFIHDASTWQGAWHYNYFLTALLALMPPMVMIALGEWNMTTALVYACIVIVIFPILFYWHSYSLWVATYYYFVPDDLRMGRDRDRDPRSFLDEALLSEDEREQLWVEDALLELEGDRRIRR